MKYISFFITLTVLQSYNAQVKSNNREQNVLDGYYDSDSIHIDSTKKVFLSLGDTIIYSIDENRYVFDIKAFDMYDEAHKKSICIVQDNYGKIKSIYISEDSDNHYFISLDTDTIKDFNISIYRDDE